MDLDTLNWQTIAPEDDCMPEEREYCAMAYDERDRRLVIFGGWNNGWKKDLYALDVSKIVGPSYACTSISPPLGQISGGVEITLKGVGFTSNNIQVFFTPGNQISMNISKMALNVQGNWVSENEITAVTPDFTVFGEKRDAVVQLTIA
jgi:dynein heavy chain